jgi:predicted aconitase with swiveling domain
VSSGRELRGHAGIGPETTAVALVANDDFSARYDLDRIRGVFSRPTHALCGKSYVGRVLVLDTAKGGVATSWMLREMAAREMAPAALLLNASNPIMAQGAAFAGLAFMDRFETDVTVAIRTGDRVTVRPARGIVVVHSALPGSGGSAGGPSLAAR